MIKLELSGIPIEWDQKKNELAFHNGLAIEKSNQKTVAMLSPVLAEPASASEDVSFRFYQGIHMESDLPVFLSHSLRYDITYLLPGLMGTERKKTTGHFHKLLPGKPVSHAELYEVLQGTALYILQPIEDMKAAGEDTPVKEILLVQVEAGSKIVVPANCAHCTVNLGKGPLIFSNLVLSTGSNEYGNISKRHGMGVYIKEEDGLPAIVANPEYDLSTTKIIVAAVKPQDSLGTAAGLPVYADFIRHPEKFAYLRDPSLYMNDIRNGLDYKFNISSTLNKEKE